MFFTHILRITIVLELCLAIAQMPSPACAASIVRFDTVMGTFDIQLFDNEMPVTVSNFLGYVNTARYDGTVVHRNSDTSDPVLRDFVIQGGGFTLIDPNPPDPGANITFSQVNKDPPINDEPGGGVAGPSNTRGTIAMAKSGPNTVTSQWFINQGDNSFLDDPSRNDGGFSAFGVVLGNGMDVVDAIGDLPIPSDFGFSISSPFNDLPLINFSGSTINDIRVENTVTVNNITLLATTPGDVNLDGVVNQSDFSIFSSGFGIAAGAFLDDGDTDLDGDVDGADFLVWQRNVGAISTITASFVTVPEPPTWLLMLSALCIASALRWRSKHTVC